MKKFLLKTKLLAILLAMNLFIAGTAIGQTNTWDGSTSNNWNTATNWSLNHVPLLAEDVVIPNNFNVTVNTAAVCNSITLTGGGSDVTVSIASPNSLAVTNAVTIGAGTGFGDNIILAVGSGSLSCASITVAATGSGTRSSGVTLSTGTATVSGNITMGDVNDDFTFSNTGTLFIAGTMTGGTFTASTGTVNYNNAGSQTVGTYTYNNLTLSGANVTNTKTTTGVTVNGRLSMEGTAVVSAALTYGGASRIQYNTATSRTAGVEWPATFSGTGGVIITNTGVITLNAAKVLNTNVDLTIQPGAGLNTSGSNFNLSFGGDFVNSGIFTANGSSIAITGNATQSIAGFNITGDVSMTKTGNTATLTGNVNADALTINGAGGTLNLGTGLTHTFTGTWTRTNGTLNGGSSTLSLSATPGPVAGAGGTFTAGTGTVDYSGAGVQTLAGLTYFNLTISGSGTKTLGANTTIPNNGTLNLAGGTLAGGAFTLTMASTSNIIRSGGDMTVTPSGGGVYNVTYTGATKTEGTELAGTGLNNLTLNLTPAESLNLTASRTLDGTLTLTNGNLVIPSSARLTITSNAQIGGAPFTAIKSIVTQVDYGTGAKGFVRVTLPNSGILRTIPVGDGPNYLPVSLTPANNNNNTFDICVFNGITVNGEPNGTAFSLSQKSFVVDAVWTVNLIAGAAPSITMTTNWPETYEGAVFSTNPDARIGISHYGAAWETVTGTGSQTNNTATRTGITVFSPFGVGGINKPLPIAIQYFNAAKGNGYNTLNWQAACSSDKAVFEIERSTDGRNFATINTVTATQAECAQSVSYVDNTILTGAVFYRIKTVDVDGKAAYSVIIKLGGTQSDIKLAGILPNPVMNTAQLNIITAKKDNVNLSIVSMEGKLVHRSTVQLQAGSSIISLDVTNLQKGVYIIKGVFADGEASSIKFVKQ
ncbi:beta strand repeat-containing protein [Ferruginibacter sp.]|nr:T9SS type A sorting domain-containing protein [Ferruginibacter sp.]